METWPYSFFQRVRRWVREGWNRPNRSDYYLMQIASTQLVGKHSLDDLKIEHRWEKRSVMPLKEANNSAKIRWGMALGVMPELVKND